MGSFQLIPGKLQPWHSNYPAKRSDVGCLSGRFLAGYIFISVLQHYAVKMEPNFCFPAVFLIFAAMHISCT